MISILLPSRKRTKLLLRCLRSIADNASSKDNFEVCLRIHRDDWETIAALHEIMAICTVRVVIGLQHDGYQSLAWFYQEAQNIARGEFVWVMNDDVVVKTKDWDKAFFDNIGYNWTQTIRMPSILTMGGSKYIDNPENPFMLLPNGCWKEYGMHTFTNQFDASLWTLLRKNGWGTQYVPIEIEHDHDPVRNIQDRKDEKSPNYDQDPHERHMENL